MINRHFGKSPKDQEWVLLDVVELDEWLGYWKDDEYELEESQLLEGEDENGPDFVQHDRVRIGVLPS